MVRSYLVEAVEHCIRALCEHAQQASSLVDYRRRALQCIGQQLAFDAALFHELSPRVPLERAVLIGLELSALAAGLGSWDENAVLFGRLRDLALEQRGVATDSAAFPVGSRGRLAWVARVNRPFQVKWTLAAHLIVGERIVAAMLLFRRRGASFSKREQDAVREALPALAIGDALHQSLSAAAPGGVPTHLRCLDQRLTPRQRDIVERVALGHTNAQIAQALALSANTVRNLLTDARKRLQAANRAEIVRLAVLR